MPKAARGRKYYGGATVIGSSEKPYDEPPLKNVHQKDVKGLEKFDILSVPDVQAQVLETYTEIIRPQQAPGGDSSVVTLPIRGTDDFIDVHHTEVVVRIRFKSTTANDLPRNWADNQKGFRKSFVDSNMLDSLWQNVEVRINDTDIKSHIFSYALMSHIRTLLSTDKDDQELLKETVYFEKDTAYDMNWDPADGDSLYDQIPSRFKRLEKMGKASHSFWVRGRIKHFLCDQKKCIPPRQDVIFTFTKAKPEKYMNSWAAAANIPQVIVEKMHLLVRRQKLNSKDTLRILSTMNKTPAIFPLKDRVELRYHNIAQNSSVYTADALFNGTSPTKVFVAFLKGVNFLGSYKTSSRNFEACGITSIYFEKNSKKYPSTGYTELNMHEDAFGTGSALYAYTELKKIGNSCTPPKILNITYEDFCNRGYTMFVFDFTGEQEMVDKGSFAKVNKAPISLTVEFSAALPEAVNCVLYNLYDSALYIHGDGQVSNNWL